MSKFAWGVVIVLVLVLTGLTIWAIYDYANALPIWGFITTFVPTTPAVAAPLEQSSNEASSDAAIAKLTADPVAVADAVAVVVDINKVAADVAGVDLTPYTLSIVSHQDGSVEELSNFAVTPKILASGEGKLNPNGAGTGVVINIGDRAVMSKLSNVPTTTSYQYWMIPSTRADVAANTQAVSFKSFDGSRWLSIDTAAGSGGAVTFVPTFNKDTCCWVWFKDMTNEQTYLKSAYNITSDRLLCAWGKAVDGSQFSSNYDVNIAQTGGIFTCYADQNGIRDCTFTLLDPHNVV